MAVAGSTGSNHNRAQSDCPVHPQQAVGQFQPAWYADMYCIFLSRHSPTQLTTRFKAARTVDSETSRYAKAVPQRYRDVHCRSLYGARCLWLYRCVNRGGEVGIPEYREPRFVKFRNQNKEGAAFRFVKQQSGRNNEVLTLV
jgi:hypothetical protein